MSSQEVEVLVVGGGQAGLAMSEHLGANGVPHLVLERHRIAERWRSERWDSLVANGPAWHDRFPSLEFVDLDPDAFASKEQVADYFVAYAEKIAAPVRCGVEVTSVPKHEAAGFRVETTDGTIDARFVVAATGPFQRPVIPPIVPDGAVHCRSTPAATATRTSCPTAPSSWSAPDRRACRSLTSCRASGRASSSPSARTTGPRGGIAVATSAGGSVCSACGTPKPLPSAPSTSRSRSAERTVVTPSTSATSPRGRGAGRHDHVVRRRHPTFRADLGENIASGDANYLSLLDEADAYVARNGLDLPEEPEARILGPPPRASDPLLELDLADAGVTRSCGRPASPPTTAGCRSTRSTRTAGPGTAWRVVRARRVLPRPAMALAARVELHLGGLARRQASRRSHHDPTWLPRPRGRRLSQVPCRGRTSAPTASAASWSPSPQVGAGLHHVGDALDVVRHRMLVSVDASLCGWLHS